MPAIELLIRLPADTADLVEQRLAPHAEVQRLPPQSFDLATIALLASIGASLGSMGVAYATVQKSRVDTVKTLLEIQKLLVEQGRAGAAQIGSAKIGTRSFADADEVFLRRLLEVES